MNETAEGTPIFAPIWRRKWLILAVALVVGAGTYLYYKQQAAVYQSSTEIYLGAGAEEQAAGERTTPKSLEINPADQVAIINSIVIEGVRQQLRKEGNLAGAKTKVRAKTAGEKSQFIFVTTEGHKPKTTAFVANQVAQAYLKRQRSYYQRSVLTAIGIARAQLRRVEAASVPKGGKGSAPSTASLLQETNLKTRINQLESLLGIAGPQQIKVAKPAAAALVAPKPRQNGIFGFFIGLLLACVVAYVLARLDRRVRALAGVESLFALPILSALPVVRRPIVTRDGAPAPARALEEPLRRLHANLQLLAPGAGTTATGNGAARSPRVILFTSAEAGDGKSTLAAGLALEQSAAGARVALVEANLRRPVLGQRLSATGPYGLAEVLAGNLGIENALQPVVRGVAQPQPAPVQEGAPVATLVESSSAGSLALLAGGAAVPNPPALLASQAMKDLLSVLAADRDYVLIDAPSPLEVSDVMPLLPLVDGVVIVARIGHTRDTSAHRLQQLLSQARGVRVLGVVANAAAPRDMESYGFAVARPGGRRTLPGR